MPVLQGDDELDLILSRIDAGIRLLGFLHDSFGEADAPLVAAGEGFVIEALIDDSHRARQVYDRDQEALRRDA